MSETAHLTVKADYVVGTFKLKASFAAEPGITAFFGRSGSGKTTLVNIVAGLTRPREGRIELGSTILFDHAVGIDQAPEHRRMGYVFQEGRLFPHLNVRDNLTYGTQFLGGRPARHELAEVTDLLDLGELLERTPGGLSGGERQRVAIGRSLLCSPDVLLMDEPLASLDAAHKGEIMPFLERLRDEVPIPIVYVSHAIDEVVRLADSVVLFDKGRTVAQGPVEEIMSRLDLRPLTGRHEAGAVFAATVRGHDTVFGLSELSFAGGRMLVAQLDLPLGRALRMRVRARDVSLSLSKPVDTSVLNVFAGRIVEISDDAGPQAEVLVDIGAPLIARVTSKSITALRLQPGVRVFASVKAAAIDRQSIGFGGTRTRQSR